jgi:opacity protein-like surface antigen
MFKMGLLMSSAMTTVALLQSPALHAASVQTDMHFASRDANTTFLCTYGGFRVSSSFFSESGFGFHDQWNRVAVPVRGRGQTVSRIRVIESLASRQPNSSFTVGIYSNTASGFPGNAIAVGSGKARPACGPVKVSITPTTLKRHTTYWIEERASQVFSQSSLTVSWMANPETRRRAYVQRHRYTYCSSRASNCSNSSYTSPWTKQTKGPYFSLR